MTTKKPADPSPSTTPHAGTSPTTAAPAAGTDPAATTAAPAAGGPAATPMEAVADPNEGLLGQTIVEFVNAVRHRVGHEQWPQLQKAATDGVKLGIQMVSGKDSAKELAAWRESVDAMPEQLRREVYGITRALIESEVRRRVAFLDW